MNTTSLRLSTAQETCKAAGTHGGFPEGHQRGNKEHQPLDYISLKSMPVCTFEKVQSTFEKAQRIITFQAP